MYNPFTLVNKTILVTGASSGIGKGIALECSRLGASVIITGRNISRLESVFLELDSSFGQQHQCVGFDLNDIVGLDSFCKSLPELSGIVHSAGFLKKVPLRYTTVDLINETMSINVVAPFLLTRHLLSNKKLLKGCSIVFISSIASKIASVGNLNYMASKGAIGSLVKGIALELSSKYIRVNSVEPALIRTPLVEANMSEADLANYLVRFPLARFGSPQDVAFAAIYFLSDASAWVTGSNLIIDGGVTLR